MTKGEKRFENALLKCLFPTGVPAAHRVKRTEDTEMTLRSIQIIGKDIAKRHGVELVDDVDDDC